MSIRSVRLAAATGALALLALGVPSAAAAPASDSQGYVDSTARCSSPYTAVVFGSTDSSRVAICKSPGGQFQYRGVRVRDGAKLILPASQSSDGGYVADNDGVTYTVTSSALVVSAGQTVLRKETMVDFHGSTSPKAPAGTTGPTTSSSSPTSSSPTTSSPTTSSSTTSSLTTSSSPTPTTPLPPPLPAEVGGSATR